MSKIIEAENELIAKIKEQISETIADDKCDEKLKILKVDILQKQIDDILKIRKERELKEMEQKQIEQ